MTLFTAILAFSVGFTWRQFQDRHWLLGLIFFSATLFAATPELRGVG